MSEPLRLNGDLDGLVLRRMQVFGVPSPPQYVVANGEKVRDFTYNDDTKVSEWTWGKKKYLKKDFPEG